jgi:hypothetical protein
MIIGILPVLINTAQIAGKTHYINCPGIGIGLAQIRDEKTVITKASLLQQVVTVKMGAEPENIGFIVFVTKVEIEDTVIVAQVGIQTLSENRDTAGAIGAIAGIPQGKNRGN